MKIKNIIGLVLVALTTGACSDWFDVLPKTNVKAEELFKDENGFQSALTGCYVRMGNTETYGRNLSYFFLEKLAQRYDDQTPNYAEINMNIYRYTDANYTKNTLAGIWNSMYQTIANVNNLLANLDGVGKEVVTTPGYWELMKGRPWVCGLSCISICCVCSAPSIRMNRIRSASLIVRSFFPWKHPILVRIPFAFT